MCKQRAAPAHAMNACSVETIPAGHQAVESHVVRAPIELAPAAPCTDTFLDPLRVGTLRNRLLGSEPPPHPPPRRATGAHGSTERENKKIRLARELGCKADERGRLLVASSALKKRTVCPETGSNLLFGSPCATFRLYLPKNRTV